MSKGGLPAIRNSDPLGGAGPLAGLGGMDSNSLKPSPRRRELTRKEKKKLYKLDTAAQESVSESVRELKGSVESLVEHEAEWRRQKDEMKKYGQANKNKANEPHRVISLKELKTPHICNAKLLKKQLEREEREEKKRLEEWHQLLAKHSKDSVKDNDRLPGGAAGQEMSSTQLVAASPEPIPDWLSTKSLSKRRYLAASTGNLHGLQAAEFNNTKWPLPKMFGQEKYAYSLIDIEDPRFVDECAGMSKQLIHYFYDQQIFDLKWRETYKQLIRAEKRRANLPALASNKAKDELDGNVKKFKKYLLELQEQRDMYQSKIDGIFERCAQIKRGIKKENDLEELRMEMTGRVKAKFAQEDGFWSTQFNCTRPDDVRGSDDDLLLSD
eukprot:g117.t1